MNRLRAVITLSFCLLLLGNEALAYTTISSPAVRWTRDWATQEVNWVLNSNGCQDMPIAQAQAALEASFQTWEDVDCAAIGFTYDGLTDQRTTGNDGVNVMVWRKPEDGWSYGSGALGVTGTWFGMGQLSDADIEFNSVHYTWDETGRGGNIDLQSVATHEIGHFLGLGHSNQASAVMFPTYPGGTSQRFLSDDDTAGVCFLYPTASGGCTTNDDCPLGHECRTGDCVPTGDGNICDICGRHEDCGGANDFCVRYPDGISRCGRACQNDGDCATAPGCGARTCLCLDMSGGGSRQCAPADFDCIDGPECESTDQCPDGDECVDEECVPRGCFDLGAACEVRDDCCSGLCLDGACSQGCDWLNAADSCPSGFYCSIQECGTGFCEPGQLGGSGRGQVCTSHEGCRTGYCGSTGGQTHCEQPCDPDGINTCPGEDSCLRIGASRCGFCACHIGRLGDPCENSFDCASGFCASSGERLCARVCGSSNPCPDGYDCNEAIPGVLSICWPQDGKGGFDAPCGADDQCANGRCVDGACNRNCEGNCDCPDGFECGDLGGERMCVHAAGDGRGCDCRVANSGNGSAAGVMGLIGLALLIVFARRRR